MMKYFILIRFTIEYKHQRTRYYARRFIMKLDEDTSYSNYKIVIDEYDIPVAVEINGEIKLWLYDEVYVRSDNREYVGRYIKVITYGGYGVILNFYESFCGVLMNNGEFGYVNVSRITKI